MKRIIILASLVIIVQIVCIAAAQSGISALSGKWDIIANGYPGTISFDGGRIYIADKTNGEALTGINFDGKVIGFHRNSILGHDSDQDYTGEVSGDTMTGTFTEVNTPGTIYQWSASRENNSPVATGSAATSGTMPEAPIAPCGEGATDLSIASPTDQYRAGPGLVPGSYKIWYGKRTGPQIGQPDNWNTKTVELLDGKFYVFDVSTGSFGEATPKMINPMLSNPTPGESVVWYKASTQYAYVVCFEGPLNQTSTAVIPSNQYTVAALTTESDWNVAPIDMNGNVGGWVAVPWTIYLDGTMEAKGSWKAKWTATGSNRIHCEMTWMASGLTDTWDMVFDTPNTFYGYDQIDNGVNQNGAKFRYGERIQPTPVENQGCSWSGTWNTNWGDQIMHQSGNEVSGSYTHDQGRIVGTVSGNKLSGTWSEAPTYSPPHDAGDVELTLSDDCKSFSGNWRYGSEGGWSGDWTGTRTTASSPVSSGSTDNVTSVPNPNFAGTYGHL